MDFQIYLLPYQLSSKDRFSTFIPLLFQNTRPWNQNCHLNLFNENGTVSSFYIFCFNESEDSDITSESFIKFLNSRLFSERLDFIC